MPDIDSRVRLAAFEFLSERSQVLGDVLPRDLLERGFEFDGRRVPLIGPQGIFKPAILSEIPLTITTVPVVEGQARPYDDRIGEGGFLEYRYRGTDPDHRDNQGLRLAMQRQAPLIYLFGVVPGRYMPAWPAYIVGDNPLDLVFTVAVDEKYVPLMASRVEDNAATEARRAYVTGVTKRRLHQQTFRQKVLRAYRECCAVCRLRHEELLEAAHILPDGHPRGEPVVPNGLALCALHHAAFDRHILGVTPELTIELRTDILREADGPMLRHGLQGFQGSSISAPQARHLRPNRDFLAERYELFRRASQVKAYVAVTDNDWYRFLKAHADIDEVNFWQPGGNKLFNVLQPGQPLLFKLHAPENFIAGGGFFAHASLLPSSLAWEAFGEKNGTGSLPEMRRRIEKYRRTTVESRQDYSIGCIILRDPFFFERQDWIPAPADFHPNIVQGKTYDLRSGIGEALWRRVLDRLQRQPTASGLVAESTPAMYGQPTLVRSRLGQGTFRILVTDIYQRRCAVTGEKALPVLEAAHIRPVSDGGLHRIDNGLLLRSDVHTLFDRGYVTITSQLRFEVSRRLREDFDNGELYYQLHGLNIRVPTNPEEHPNREFLEWHADTVFLRRK